MLRNLVSILTSLLITSARCGEELQGAQFDFGGGRGASREVLQLSDRERTERFVCALNRDEIQDVLDETSRTWRVDRVALRNADGDLQAIVNCSEEGDTILLDVGGILQFSRRVVIPWRLTLSGNVRQTVLEDGIFPEARRKQRVGCPQDDEGVFFIRARDVLFANIVFEDCSLNSTETSTAIVETEACRNENLTGSVQLHHVDFVRNHLEGAVALNMSHAPCSALELVDVAFENNTCSGFCGAVMSTENELRNVRISGTTRVGEVPTTPAVLYAPRDSRTTAENVVAADNQGAVLYVERGELQASDCEFLRNEGEANANGLHYGGGIHLERATATIRRCTFDDNVAIQGAAIHAFRSKLTIRNCVFNRNEAEEGGAAVYLFRCKDVDVEECSFRENSLPLLDGGGIFSNATNTLTLKRSRFQNNNAGTGSAVYVVEGPLDVEDCQFLNNTALADAGALYFSGTVVEARRVSFFNNSAVGYGGACLVLHSDNVTISDLTCEDNTAEYGGCLRVRNTTFSLNSSVFVGNSASARGGGLSVNTSIASISDCLLSANHGDIGGGLDLEVVESAELHGVTIERNNATTTGAGAVFRTGRFNVTNCTFEGNSCQRHGGGFTCGLGANVTSHQSLFLSNVAPIGGAGSSIIVDCTAVFSNSTWISNRAAEGNGAGALVEGGRGFFEDCLFEQNLADRGGGVYFDDSPGALRRVVFRSNGASTLGGGMAGGNGTVNITDCYAEGNRARHGGAIFFSTNSSLIVRRFVAVLNIAEGDGGALGLYAANATVSDSVFTRNSANSRGTVDLTTSWLTLLNVTVTESSSDSHGGALLASRGSVVNSTASFFAQNNATRHGGSLVILESRAYLTDTAVTSSQAEDSGGGIFLQSATVHIVRGNISDNFSVQEGGGMFAQDSFVTTENLTVVRNTADDGAGGIEFSFRNNTFLLTGSNFTQNRGTNGGALGVYLSSSGQLIDTYAFNNSALTSGGFVYVDESNLTITGGQFIENKGSIGGDAAVTSSGRLSVEGTEFRNGSATQRGGCLATGGGSFVVIQDSLVSATEAGSGGAISLFESYFWGHSLHFQNCIAETDGGAIVANQTSSVLCTGCVFDGNSAGDKGGAVYLESFKTQLLAFQFDNCSFEDNSAVLGGALHFVNEDRLVNCTESGANCTFVGLRGSNFVQNEALSAGGALLSNDLNSIRVNCSYSPQSNPLAFMNRSEFEMLPILNSLENVCPMWSNNTARDYGDDLASYARRVRKVIRFQEEEEEQEVEGNIYYLQDHLSGTQIPALFLEVVDELGQGPATGSGNATIEATMWSPDGLFTGSVRIHLEDGWGNFSGISGYRQPGFYDVRVDFSERSIPAFTILVEVRRCRIGEAAAANGTVCQPCSGNEYNFYPDRMEPGCVACPEDANCEKKVIHPRKGCWHSSPCSRHIQECLTRRACDEEGRDEKLEGIGETVQNCSLSAQFIENYANAECRDGYHGPLCGSCDDGFGRSRSFRCESCFRGFSNFVLVFLSVAVLLMLSSFAIRSSLPSHRRTGRLSAPGSKKTSASATPRADASTSSSPPVNLQMVQMLHTGHVPREIIEAKNQPQAETSQQNQQRLVELTKWKAVEIFKITVNYLQVIAVAIAVNVNWTETLVGVFETAEFIGGVTSEAATRSVDCLISSNSTIPRSAVRTVVNIMVPMLVTALYFVFWTFAQVRLQETAEYLVQRCVLSFMAVSYLSYIALTKTVVNVLSCVKVHDSTDLDDDSTTRYWSLDTSLQCYEGSHAVLAALIGWPVLILFSLGFPVGVALVLLNQRNRNKLQSEWLFESMGFMYRAYSGSYVFWESIIMLRKAILAIVVVFSYSLGGNLQGVLGVCVLMIALYFQTVCSPFRLEFDGLNNYEGLSLLVSAMTFISGLFFNDDRTPPAVRMLLTVCLVLANCGLLLFFVAMFWKTIAEYLETLMDAEGKDYNPDKGAFHVVRTYACSRLKEHWANFTGYFFTRDAPQADQTV